MVDFAGIAATAVIGKFVDSANESLNRAHQHLPQDVQACQNYLEAAYQAIIGLEAEYDRLLAEVKSCDLRRLEEVSSVIRQIEIYLTVDRLRPILRGAIAGLHKCRDAFRAHSDRVLQWPWRWEDRQAAVRNFEYSLRDLEQYLSKLEAHDIVDGQPISGVGASSLNDLRHWLYRFQDTPGGTEDRSELVRSVLEMQKNRNKNPYLQHLDTIQRQIQSLAQAFR